VSVTETITINAPREVVWALIDDPDRLASWIPEVVETQYPEGRPRNGGPNVVFRQVLMRNGTPSTYDGQVTGFKRGELLAVMLTDGNMTITAKYRLDGDDTGGTRLEFEGDLQMRNRLVGLLMMTVWPVTRAMMLTQVQRLKSVAEAVHQKAGNDTAAKGGTGRQKAAAPSKPVRAARKTTAKRIGAKPVRKERR
jgi:carbon monoxide dehydrogenase subunit G